MLPFDNKSEFQVAVNMPAGTALTETASFTEELAGIIRTVPEVVSVQTYSGTAIPFDFNGFGSSLLSPHVSVAGADTGYPGR